MKVVRYVRRYLALIFIVVAFAWSAYKIQATRTQDSPPNMRILRIAHWQLETGVKDALEVMAKRYQAIHPDVQVVQEIIPDSSYGIWLTTNLIGGTAPDMIEVPDSSKMPEDVMISFYNRYILPVTPYVHRPNPYNAGNEFAKVSLRQTYKDGMRFSYIKEFQEYMNIPLSLFGVRIFYNKDLYKKLTGLDRAPRDYREFIAVCEKISSQKNEKGQAYIPVAASQDSIWSFEQMMFDPLTYPAIRKLDFDRDGIVGREELFAGVMNGKITMDCPVFKARFDLIREVTRQFQVGFTGLGRDDGVFAFAQQRGVFLSTGTWEARGLQAQAAGTFEIGVMDFPMPSKDDPEFGQFVEGPRYEDPEGGFPVGVTRSSPNRELAIDFLLFMTSKEQNQEMNRIMGWIPIINDTKMEPFFEAFSPHLEGVYGTFSIYLGSDTRQRYDELYSMFLADEKIKSETMLKEFEEYYKRKGKDDFRDDLDDWRRLAVIDEQLLAILRVTAMAARNDAAKSEWIRYRYMTDLRGVIPEIDHSFKAKLVHQKIALPDTGPYEYSPEVLQRIRERIKRESAAK